MSKIPQTPAEIFGLFIDDCKEIFGNDLDSIILFGSGARGEYQPKKSDINFLIVLSPQGMKKIQGMVNYIPKWRKRAINIPLLMTREYIQHSLDSYPLEFLDMKLYHMVVYGDDLFGELEIKSSDLRLQCEREVKGKLIHLRQNFVASGLKPKIMRQILIQTIPTFRIIFEGLLSLKNEVVPDRVPDIFKRTAEVFGLEKDVLQQILDLKFAGKKPGKEELINIFVRYIETIEKLSKEVDRL